MILQSPSLLFSAYQLFSMSSAFLSFFIRHTSGMSFLRSTMPIGWPPDLPEREAAIRYLSGNGQGWYNFVVIFSCSLNRYKRATIRVPLYILFRTINSIQFNSILYGRYQLFCTRDSESIHSLIDTHHFHCLFLTTLILILPEFHNTPHLLAPLEN